MQSRIGIHESAAVRLRARLPGVDRPRARTLGDSRMPCDMKWPPGPLLFFKQWMDEERCLAVSHLVGHGKSLASHGFQIQVTARALVTKGDDLLLVSND